MTSPDRETTIAFYLVPEFTMLAFTSAIEPLRLTNQVVGFGAYKWRLISLDGGNVRASCGVSVSADHSLTEERALNFTERRSRMVIVCGGKNIEKHYSRPLGGWLRECRQSGGSVGALCTGAHILAEAGLLQDRRCTIHWEKYPVFAERFATISPSSGIYEVDNGIYTCAGGAASFDMMLHLIEQRFGPAVTTAICHQALIGRVRDKAERQRLPFASSREVVNPALRAAVIQMEENLAEPIPLTALAARLHLSRRQVERLFHRELGCSPARYYLGLRLERAKLLLSQTAMPIIDIAIACGFVSASHFSKCYRAQEGISPQESRKADCCPSSASRLMKSSVSQSLPV